MADIPSALQAQTADLQDSIPSGIVAGMDLAGLADLPSSILGNEGPEGSGGLLSEVFYPDGAVGDGLSIPDLSLAASSSMPTAVGDALGFLGLSYVDTAIDHHGQGPGLNALSML